MVKDGDDDGKPHDHDDRLCNVCPDNSPHATPPGVKGGDHSEDKTTEPKNRGPSSRDLCKEDGRSNEIDGQIGCKEDTDED